MNLLKQPPGACYLYVALQGMLRSDLGRRLLQDAARSDGDGGFLVTFRPRNRDPWERRVTQDMIAAYYEAADRRLDPAVERWIPALEVGYNEYLRHTRSRRGYFQARTSRGYVSLRAIGGTTGDFLQALVGAYCRRWWLPSEESQTEIFEGDTVSAETDLQEFRGYLETLQTLIAEPTTLVICLGTRAKPGANPEGLVLGEENPHQLASEHGYWVEKVGEDSLTLVDLRSSCQRRIIASSSEMVNHLCFIDAAVL